MTHKSYTRRTIEHCFLAGYVTVAPVHPFMEPVIRRMRLGWSVSNGRLLVVAATRNEALERFRALSAAEAGPARVPRCGAEGCSQPAVAIFNVAWLCAVHCHAALDELRNVGGMRPVEFAGDVHQLLRGARVTDPAGLATEELSDEPS